MLLERRLLQHGGQSAKCSIHKNMSHLQSDYEEADTKMILHALDATADGATDLSIYPPDTDVFVLAIRRYPEMCSDTSFITGKIPNHRTMKLEPIVDAPLTLPKQALPAFHAITGADNTGSLSGIKRGKLLAGRCSLTQTSQ